MMFNTRYYYDESLREVAESPCEMNYAAEHLSSEFQTTGDPSSDGMAGVYFQDSG